MLGVSTAVAATAGIRFGEFPSGGCAALVLHGGSTAFAATASALLRLTGLEPVLEPEDSSRVAFEGWAASATTVALSGVGLGSAFLFQVD